MPADPCHYASPETGACCRAHATHWGQPCPGDCALRATREQVRRARETWGRDTYPRPMEAASPAEENGDDDHA